MLGSRLSAAVRARYRGRVALGVRRVLSRLLIGLCSASSWSIMSASSSLVTSMPGIGGCEVVVMGCEGVSSCFGSLFRNTTSFRNAGNILQFRNVLKHFETHQFPNTYAEVLLCNCATVGSLRRLG